MAQATVMNHSFGDATFISGKTCFWKTEFSVQVTLLLNNSPGFLNRLFQR